MVRVCDNAARYYGLTRATLTPYDHLPAADDGKTVHTLGGGGENATRVQRLPREDFEGWSPNLDIPVDSAAQRRVR